MAPRSMNAVTYTNGAEDCGCALLVLLAFMPKSWRGNPRDLDRHRL